MIDLKSESSFEKIFTKEEYTQLEYRTDGYYFKETGEVAYLFSIDFTITKF